MKIGNASHRRIAFVSLFCLISFIHVSKSEECFAQEMMYETRDVATGLNNPWEMRYREGWIFFTERPGKFSKVNVTTGEKKQLLFAEDCYLWWEAGMLGFDFHPDFPDSPYIYVAYVHRNPEPPKLELFRYRYTGDSLIERTSVFGPIRAGYMHDGCRVVMNDRKIYLSLGELNEPDSAQSLTTPQGKIVRLNLDGSIPEDNPFPGSPIWTYGHRNPQGLEFASNGIVYSSEHGDATDDEVNILTGGKNYGWPLVAGECDSISEQQFCESIDITYPLKRWTPTIAVGDIGYYNYDTCREWKNSLLVATLKDQCVHQLKLDSTGTKVIAARRIPIMLTSLNERAGRLRSICFSPEGRVFLSTANGLDAEDENDRIIELWRTGVHPYYTDLVTPLEGAAVLYQSASFIWRAAMGDSKYQFQVSTTQGFEPENLIIDSIQPDTMLVVPSLPTESWLYWRVREVTSEGPWSFFRGFATVTSSVEPQRLTQFDFSPTVVANKLVVRTKYAIGQCRFRVFDVRGSEVFSRDYVAIEANTPVDLTSVHPGYYLVTMVSNGSTLSKPIIVK